MTTFIWMFVVLKIPIAALLWLVWWAAKEPEPVGVDEDDGGSKRPERPHGPHPSRPPRRGPHTGAPPPAPPRVRTRAVGRHVDAPR
jgi:hypothetical protein